MSLVWSDKLRRITTWCLCCMSLSAFAQSGPIGSWRSHLPYQSFPWVTQSPSKVIYATEWSILTIDKDDFSIDQLSKVDGLSDTGIDRVEYDAVSGALIIAYSNSNVDIVYDDQIINVPDIEQNTNLQGDKRINDILIQDSLAYLSTGFGVVQYDLSSGSFGFTTFTDLPILDAAIFDNELYVATADGIYRSDIDTPSIVDFDSWSILDVADGLPLAYACSALTVYNDELYAAINDDQLWRISNTARQQYEVEDTRFSIEYLSADGEHLIMGIRDQVSQSQAIIFDASLDFVTNRSLCDDRTRYSVEDEQGRIWYADDWNEIRYSENKNEPCKRIQIDSPFSHEMFDISVENDEILVASGGATENYLPSSSRLGFYTFRDEEWTNWNQDSYQPIKDNDLLNFVTIRAHPNNEKVYIGTYWGGLLELDRADNTSRVFTQENSSLGGTIGDEQRERITGLVFDSDRNLWITNFGAARPLSVLTPDDEWQSFNTVSNGQLTDIVVDRSNHKWIRAFGQNGGVVVYKDNGTPTDLSDDEQRLINASNSELTTNNVTALAVDLDGSVWVGTAEGPVVFDCGNDPIDQDCTGRRIKVLQDSIAAFLLADVEIRAIAVDGANRKWFGSRNGIFVQSANGVDQVLRFTADDSPLFDDNIIDLAYNGTTGEMVIATNKGLQSYRTATTSATRVHERDVLVFPNPVRPDYTGPIVIRGLGRDAEVKITDINGVVAAEIVAQGGTAVWDGTDMTGARVASGVYLVFSTSAVSFDTPDSVVAKILFTR